MVAFPCELSALYIQDYKYETWHKSMIDMVEQRTFRYFSLLIMKIKRESKNTDDYFKYSCLILLKCVFKFTIISFITVNGWSN